jgi:hypothetical protein
VSRDRHHRRRQRQATTGPAGYGSPPHKGEDPAGRPGLQATRVTADSTKHTGTEQPEQDRPRFRCGGCGVTVIPRAPVQPADPCVCIPCSPYVLGSQRIRDLMAAAHDRGLTLRELVALAQAGRARR